MATRVVELARSGDLVVNKKYGMSYAEFKQEHLDASCPVVIGDATQSWVALKKFTPEFFKENYGKHPVEINNRHYLLGDVIDQILTSTERRPAPYPCKLSIDLDAPELLADIEPRFAYSLPDRINSRLVPRRFMGGAANYEVFIGGPGGQFPYLHYDYMGLHALINQVYGEKEFTVISPAQTDLVYPDPENPWKSLVADHRHPDLNRHPLFAQAHPISFVVGPGETLFSPNGWWHTACSRTVTISVAFDFLNASNWARFAREVQGVMRNSSPIKRAAAGAYLALAGTLLGAGEAIRGRPKGSRHLVSH